MIKQFANYTEQPKFFFKIIAHTNLTQHFFTNPVIWGISPPFPSFEETKKYKPMLSVSTKCSTLKYA